MTADSEFQIYLTYFKNPQLERQTGLTVSAPGTRKPVPTVYPWVLREYTHPVHSTYLLKYSGTARVVCRDRSRDQSSSCSRRRNVQESPWTPSSARRPGLGHSFCCNPDYPEYPCRVLTYPPILRGYRYIPFKFADTTRVCTRRTVYPEVLSVSDIRLSS